MPQAFRMDPPADEFEPRLGKQRAAGSPRGRRYLASVLAAAARGGQAGTGKRRRYSGERSGRGGAEARVLGMQRRARRAMVKVRLVKLAGTSAQAAARAHLRYIQRDSASGRDTPDAPGGLYSAAEDEVDGKAFLERCGGDRHQFRLIVSAEDGAEYEDLRPLIRRVMKAVEGDLGTKLDWVAADHRDTLHPHTHVLLRGKDERGADLVIAREYLSHGFRQRVAEQVSLDLGPRTAWEMEASRRREIGAERLTPLDRRLIRGMDQDRVIAAAGRDMRDTAFRTGRLRKLAALGLAEEHGSGRWRLAPGLEQRLRELGERGDIIRTMQRAIRAGGIQRPATDQVVHARGLGTGEVLVGRVLQRGLADEAADRHYLLVDGADGRLHHVQIGAAGAVQPLEPGTIIQVSARVAEVRDADRTVAEMAAASGRYDPQAHLAEPGASREFVRAHVRRLEAIRRSVGGIERLEDGRWRIDGDHLARAERYEQAKLRDQPVQVEVLSLRPLGELGGFDGQTWLDRELASAAPVPLREAGFGAEANAAKAVRRAWLVAQDLASESADGWQPRCNFLAVLRTRELKALGERLGREFGEPLREAAAGERLSGTLRRRVDLAGQRFALLQGSGELVLVPWRPDLERQLGRELSGRVGPSGLSWTAGRSRGPEIG